MAYQENRQEWTPAHLTKPEVAKNLEWWNVKGEDQANSITTVLSSIRTYQTSRFMQLALNAKLYGNRALWTAFGPNQLRMTRSAQVPADRLTVNVIQSTIDTRKLENH